MWDALSGNWTEARSMDVRTIKKTVKTEKERLQFLNEIFKEYSRIATRFEIINDPLYVEVYVWLE